MVNTYIGLGYLTYLPGIYFYRAMHYSAKRGIAIACRPSDRPSVCNVAGSGIQDHIALGWKSWQLIARTISPTPSLFAAIKAIHLLPVPWEHGKILRRLD